MTEEKIKEKKEEKAEKPNWMKMKPAELEKIVVDLGKQGNTPAKIGLILRDQHGIPKAKMLGKRISMILKENNVQFKTEKDYAGEKIKNIEAHSKLHKHDYSAKRALTKTLWSIQKLK
jgi:small subunit ribosomal protein S15